MNVVDLHIEEIFEENDSYFRLTIQAGAVKIRGRLPERSLIHLVQGDPAAMRDAEVSGWVKPVGYKQRLEIDTDSLNLRKVEWL